MKPLIGWSIGAISVSLMVCLLLSPSIAQAKTDPTPAQSNRGIGDKDALPDDFPDGPARLPEDTSCLDVNDYIQIECISKPAGGLLVEEVVFDSEKPSDFLI